jgi:predicted secreted Zn-dependent protease
MTPRVWVGAWLLAVVGFGCDAEDDEAPARGAPGSAEAGRAGATNAGGQAGAAAGGGGAAGATAAGGASAGTTLAGAAGGGAAGTTVAGAGGTSAGTAGGDAAAGAAGAAGHAGSAGAGLTHCPEPLVAGDTSHLDATEHVETYAVSGTTAQQLRQSIDTNRGHEYDAETVWNIHWSFQNCQDPQWSLTLDIAYSMPSWAAPSTADAALLDSWHTYLDALYCHEYGHGEIGLDCANAVYDALSDLQPTGDCDALSVAATTEFESVLAECRTRETAYDADTNHGATMGAVFPP